MSYESENLASVRDVCPRCGPVRLTTANGVLVAVRDDGRRCTCSVQVRAEAAARRVDAILRAGLGTAVPARPAPAGRASASRVARLPAPARALPGVAAAPPARSARSPRPSSPRPAHACR